MERSGRPGVQHGFPAFSGWPILRPARRKTAARRRASRVTRAPPPNPARRPLRTPRLAAAQSVRPFLQLAPRNLQLPRRPARRYAGYQRALPASLADRLATSTPAAARWRNEYKPGLPGRWHALAVLSESMQERVVSVRVVIGHGVPCQHASWITPVGRGRHIEAAGQQGRLGGGNVAYNPKLAAVVACGTREAYVHAEYSEAVLPAEYVLVRVANSSKAGLFGVQSWQRSCAPSLSI